MTAQTRNHEALPLASLTGANIILELFADHLTIRRTDPLATFLPDMFDEVRTIDLNDIRAVYLHESRYTYSPWVTFILQLANHKHITLLYHRKEQSLAVAIRQFIEEAMSRRHAAPPAAPVIS